MTQRIVNYTYGTGNPVLPDGSVDVRDGVDNLQSFDVFMNAPEDEYNQRDGVITPTVRGAIKALGPVVTAWTFTTGGTLNYPNEAALNPADGNYYGWVGAFPKVVSPGTNPALPGSGYVPRTDVVLRNELAQADSNILVAGALASVVATAATSCVYAEDYPTFADAVATGKSVLYSESYTITSPITLAAGQRVSKVGGGLLTFTGANAFTLSSGNVLEFCEFAGPNDVPALRANGGVKDIKILHPICNTCPLLRTNYSLTYADADWVGKTNIVQNVTIINPIGYGDSAVGAGNTFMETRYIDGFTVIGGFCKNYYFGHYYWGGDSDFGRDGSSKSNVRKCDNIELIGFTTVNCHYAGLWGSMAQKVRRTNCSCVRATVGGDVGIDDEGTESAINVNCHAEGYQNGNFAGFFGFSDIQMIGCTSRQYAGYPHYRNYNSSNNAAQSGRVLIIGGAYTTIDPQNGFATITAASGPAKNFHVTGGAKLTDSIISIETNSGSVTVDNAHLDFTVAGSTPWDAIFIKASAALRLAVSDCLITYSVTPYAGSAAIKCNTENFNASDRVTVKCNDTGILPIVLKETGSNAGISGRFWCYDNITAAVTRENSGAMPLTVVRGDNNYTIAGTLLTI